MWNQCTICVRTHVLGKRLDHPYAGRNRMTLTTSWCVETLSSTVTEQCTIVMSKFEMNDQIIEAIEYAIFDSFDTQRGKATCKLVSSIRCLLREPSFPSTIVQCTDGTFSYLLADSDQHVPTQWNKYLISFCKPLSGSTCLLCSELVSYHRIGDINECFDYQHSAIHCSFVLELGSNNSDSHASSGV